MFRLTTKVAVSPASSTRSSSAATPHLLDHLRPRLGEERRQLLLAEPIAAPALLDRPGGHLGRGRRLLAAARAAPRDEAPVLELHDVEDPLLHPIGIEVLRIGAEPLGERIAARRELLADLMRARERLLGRDVIAVARQPAEIGRPRLDQLGPPVGEIWRNLNADIGHQPLAFANQALHLVDGDGRCPLGHDRGGPGPGDVVRRPGPPATRCLICDVRNLGPVVTRVRHEVLEDHLLDVAVLGMHGGDRLEGADPLLRRLADADQDPGGERDSQLPGEPHRLQPLRRMLGRRALVDHEVGVDRLQHQPLGGGHLPQPAEVLAREDAEVRVRQQATLQALLAGPDDVRGEVLVAPLPQPRGDLGVDLGTLPGEYQQLLRVAPHRLLQTALDLIRVVDVRAVRREGAVLAVALARPRQRERVVAREGHPAHGRGT